jgi:hypothetical protein
MTETAPWTENATAVTLADSPPHSTAGDGVLTVAATDSAVAADVALQYGIGTAATPTCIVATQAPLAELDSYVSERAPTRPPIGYVDATDTRPAHAPSTQVQAIENVPSAHDLLQLTTAISDVLETIAPPDTPTNIVIPVVDSFLSVGPTDRVVRVLSYLAESTDGSGQVVIGLNYTRGSSETLQLLTDHSDTVLWADQERADVGQDEEQRQ